MIGRLFRFVVGAAFFLLVVWGETVGTVHAFRQHGVGEGFAAVFIPPFAWWRGLEFFNHRRPLSADEFDRLFESLAQAHGIMIREPTGPVLIDMKKGEELLDSLTQVYGTPARRVPPADPCMRYRLSRAAQVADESLMVARWGPRDASGSRSSMNMLSNDEKLQEIAHVQSAIDSLMQVRCAHLR